MASNSKLSILLLSLIICLQYFTLSSSTSSSNIQTFFPSLPSPAFIFTPPEPPTSLLKSSGDTKFTKAIVATAFSSFAFSFLLFFAIQYFTAKKRGSTVLQPFRPKKGSPFRPNFRRNNGSNAAIDENRLYGHVCHNCHKPYQPSFPRSRQKERHQLADNSPRSESDDDIVQEKPLLKGSLNSSSKVFQRPFGFQPSSSSSNSSSAFHSNSTKIAQTYASPRPGLPPRSPSISNTATLPQIQSLSANSVPVQTPQPAEVVMTSNAEQRQAPPQQALTAPGPRPLIAPGAPPPPPPGGKRPAPPPPMPGGGPTRPPAPPGSTALEAGSTARKMKPLHWDKVNPNTVDHSVVWNKMSNSFTIDDDIMEALFGNVVTSKKNPKEAEATSSSTAAPNPICLLEPRKSQNIAIVIRSLSLSRQDILNALLDGHGLSTEVLEKLTKIAPTKEEEALIRNYDGNPARLANAENFLFHLFRSAPTPFTRFEAMLLKSNYEPEIAHLKKSLKSLELACQEMRNRGMFLKLLEAVLKAGNRMNAGTARGNAQAFNLTALCKLSDVKSTDGTTTLLHFVVQEVVRAEGKRLVVNRNHSLRRLASNSSDSPGATLDRITSRAGRGEREIEYMNLGLPVVSVLSSELSNVKKAAGIDYDALSTTCSSVVARVAELQRFLKTCIDDGFTAEMKSFVYRAEEELKLVKEQDIVLELVKSTTEYYQAGASKDKGTNPLQLFIVVRDFLEMVDKACLDIAKNQEKKKQAAVKAEADSSSRGSFQPGTESPKEGSESGRFIARFSNLPAHFMSDNSKSDSSSDEED